MTDRCETGKSDGCRILIVLLSVSVLEGRIPPSKKQESAIGDIPQTGRPADLPAIRQAYMRAI